MTEEVPSLSQRLNEDLKDALRSGDEVRKRTIRMLSASLKNQQIENRAPLDRQQELSVVQKEAKIRRESASEYEKIDRPDLVEQALADLSVLEGYLPDQMSEDEISAIVERAVQSTGATSQRDVGRVMATVLPQVAGRAEGSVVSRLVRHALVERGASGDG